MRNPSVHIGKDDLKKVFQRFGIEVKLIEPFMLECMKHRITNRVLLTGNKRNIKKISDAIDDATVGKFAATFKQFMTDNKLRRKVESITPMHSDWQYVKKAAKIYLEFCDEFVIDIDTEMYDFILLSYKVMGNNINIRKFAYYRTRIFDEYEIISTIDDDSNQDTTIALFNAYMKMLTRETTVDVKEFKNTKTFYHFVKAAEYVANRSIRPDDWIKSQFDALSYLDAVPEPNQMHGKHAEERYRRYLLKTKVR